MLVSPTNPPGFELYSYANAYFCFALKTCSLITWVKTLYKAITEQTEEFKIKAWFYNYPQYCDNIGDTLFEKTDRHNNTILRNNKLAGKIWKKSWIFDFFHYWGAIARLFQKLVHRVSSALQNTRKQ